MPLLSMAQLTITVSETGVNQISFVSDYVGAIYFNHDTETREISGHISGGNSNLYQNIQVKLESGIVSKTIPVNTDGSFSFVPDWAEQFIWINIQTVKITLLYGSNAWNERFSFQQLSVTLDVVKAVTTVNNVLWTLTPPDLNVSFSLVNPYYGTGTLTVTPTSATIPATGGNTAIQVTSNTTWTVSSDQSWLTLSAAGATGSLNFTATATANPTATNRTAIITVSGNGVSPQTVTITQAAGTATGIETTTSSDAITLFPNPASDWVKISGLETGEYEIKLLNSIGVLNLEVPYTKGNEINISSLLNGVYFLQVSNENGQIIGREVFIKK